MRFIGNYDQHECKVELKNVAPSDVGKWECELEEYVFAGSRGSGYTDKKSVTLKLNVTNEGKNITICRKTRYKSFALTYVCLNKLCSMLMLFDLKKRMQINFSFQNFSMKNN